MSDESTQSIARSNQYEPVVVKGKKKVSRKVIFVKEALYMNGRNSDGIMERLIVKPGQKFTVLKPSSHELNYIEAMHKRGLGKNVICRINGVRRYVNLDLVIEESKFLLRRERLYAEGILQKKSERVVGEGEKD